MSAAPRIRVQLALPNVGDQHDVAIPASFATREGLVAALRLAEGNGAVSVRALSALVGVCTRVGRHSTAKLAPDWDYLRYGGDVYDWLRAQGVPAKVIIAAGKVIMPELFATLPLPTADEVEDAAGPLGDESKESDGSTPSTER